MRAIYTAILFTVLSASCAAQDSRIWASYYGGSSLEYGFSMSTDTFGNVYIAGPTASTSGIASGGFQNTYGGGSYDAFLAKFDAAGNRLWATYYGGTSVDMGHAITNDQAGNVYLTGKTSSASGISFNGFQNTNGGGLYDAFLVKFDSSGNRLWATYYGGTLDDRGNAVAVDALGNVYLCGQTSSTSNISSGGFQNVYGGGVSDAFLVKFDSLGNRIWSTYYGGASDDKAWDLSCDALGDIHILGTTSSISAIAFIGFQNMFGGGTTDAFLVKFSSLGSRIWATYYGGSGEDQGASVSNDNSGNTYIVGYTDSQASIASGGFQTAFGGGLYDAFLVKLDLSGNRLWATYYGNTGEDYGLGVATDSDNNVYLAGDAVGNIGFSSGGFQNTFGGGASDAFLAKFDSIGNRLCATYYGGTGDDYGVSVCIDNLGNVYLSGSTTSNSGISSNGFQNTFGGGASDAFLTKFSSCLNTGINNHIQTENIVIYPNPSTGEFSINFITIGSRVEIYDFLGKTVYKSTIKDAGPVKFNLTGETKGVYLICCFANGSIFSTQRIVVID